MQLAAHELLDLNELVLGCVNSITCTGLFINHARDPELKAMLMRHQLMHIAAYNQKLAYLQQQPQQELGALTAPPAQVTLSSFNMTTAEPAAPVTPRTNAQTLDDREIATAYLLDMKRSSKDCAWAAIEMSHPDLRRLVEESGRASANHAYEIWQYMAARGYYPVRPAPERYRMDLATMYHPVTDGQMAAELATEGQPMAGAPGAMAGMIPPVAVPQIVLAPTPAQPGPGM